MLLILAVTSARCAGAPQIHEAALEGDAASVERLVSDGQDINISLPERYYFTPLHAASANGHLEVVLLLLESGADPDSTNEFAGRTPLHIVARYDHPEVANALIRYGASVDAKPDAEAVGRLQNVVPSEDYGHLLPEWPLISEGKALNDWSSGDVIGAQRSLGDAAYDGYENVTPLWVASTSGSNKIVKVLLAVGAEPDSQGILGMTPLFGASLTGHVEIVNNLLDAGADPNKSSKFHTYKPLHAAALQGHIDVISSLLDSGANIDGKTEQGEGVLHVAMANQSGITLEYLIERGANLELEDELGLTPLLNAALSGKPEFVRLLHDNRADINATMIGGRNALHIAASLGHQKVVETLISLGIDMELKDDEGQTALDNAVTRGYLEIAELLQAHVAD